MALSRIQTAEIADNAVTTSKVDDATVIATDIIDGTIVDSMVASGAAIAHTKCDLGTVAGLDVGTGANQIVQMDSTPKLPALNGSALTNLTAANLTGSFPTSPALSGAALTGIVTDFTPLENQMTRLALHIGAVEQLAKYNMIDQVIDDYEDATGIDASASSSIAELQGSAGAKYYSSIYTAASYHTADSDTMFLLQSNSSANGNATFTDTSGNGATLSAVGSMTHSTSEAKFGSSALKFNGSSGIEIASGDISFPASDWTIEFWIKHPVGSVYGSRILGHFPSGNNNQFFMRPQTTNDGNGYGLVYAGWGGTSGNFTGSPIGSDLIQTNNWVHVAIVQEGSRLRQFINGVNQGDWALNSNCNGGNPSASPTDKWHIGTNNYPEPSGYNEFLRADTYMDDIRFSDVARYTGTTTFAPNEATTTGAAISLVSESTTAESTPTKASIVLQTEDELGTATINTDVKTGVSRDALNYVDTTLAKIGTWGSGNVYAANDVTMPGTVMTKDVTVRPAVAAIPSVAQGEDHSASTHTITESSAAQYSTTQKYFGTHGMSFASQHISAAASSDFLFTGDFTVEMWLRYDTLPGNYYHFNIGPINDFAFKGYSGMMQFICGAQTILQPSGVFATNTWNHWALVRSGSTCTIYKDGVSLGTGTKTGTIGSSSTGVTLGYAPGGSVPFDGWLDEVRISDVARYTSDFSVATSEFVPDSNTKLLLHANAVATVPAVSQAFKVDGTAQATQTLTEGYTYKFDTSDSTMSGHTLKFATAVDAAGSTEYTTGVTEVGTPGSAGAYTQIVVAASAPTLYYYCSAHASMGGQANTPAEAATTSMRYKIETANQSYTAGAAAMTDVSSSAHTVTATNAVISTASKKIGTHSVLFDGDGDRVEITSHSDFGFGTNPFTIEFWYNVTTLNGDVNSSAQNLFIGDNGYNSAWCITLANDFYPAVYLGSSRTLYSATAPTLNTWYHLAWVREGTGSNQSKLYINGTLASNGTGTVNNNFANSGNNLFLGQQGNTSWRGTTRDLEGYLEEIRISNVARYTANFTAFGQGGGTIASPTQFTSDANTKLLVHGGAVSASGKITRIHGTSLAWK